MKTSEDIQEICKALTAFHSEVGRIAKDANNPHFKNRYATIDQIIEEIRPVLAANGLFIIQLPTNTEAGEIQMVTRIYHTSGQWMESPILNLKPDRQNPQGIGSAVTYARRYSLTSFLSLNTGEDDDGNYASFRKSDRRKKQMKEGRPTADKLKEIVTKWEELGYDSDSLKAQLYRMFGCQSVEQLTKEEAETFLNKLIQLEEKEANKDENQAG